jgi:hypothetical protein
VIGLSATTLAFVGVEGGSDPATQTIEITNTGEGTLNWTITVPGTTPWLIVTPSSGTTTNESDELTVRVTLTGLTAAGSPYEGTFTVTAGGATNSPQTVDVSFTVNEPGQTSEIALSTLNLTFQAEEGGANPADQVVQLTNAGGGMLDWTCAASEGWLNVTPNSGTTTTETDTLTVSVDTVGLAAADSPFNGQITVEAPGALNTPRAIDVTLVLNPQQACETIGGSIDEDTTLTAGCYIVESSLNVTGATLTIQPGTILRFQQGKEMTVATTGKLVAVGTATEPIVFTGEEPIRGYWGGLRFYQSNSTQNELRYVTIEYGGGYWDANLVISGSSSSPARVKIANCTLAESETDGLYVNEYSVIDEFASNVITANAQGVAYMAADVVGYLDDTSSYVGNDADFVRIWGSTVSRDQEWAGIDADYLAEGSITVSANLTIDPGARIVFTSGEEMTVDNDGTMAAAGTADSPIVFTGAEQTRGFWGGLRFYQSNSTDNELDYVVIEYGGGYWDADLVLSGTSSSPVRVKVTNSTMQGSGTYGLYANEYVVIDEFAENTLTQNISGAAWMDPDVLGYLDDASTYTGNDEDYVEAWGGTVSSDQTWAGIDAEYLLNGVTVSAQLTIEPGARLVFASGEEMTVDAAGALSAVGTQAEPIVFTGVEQTPGYWGGLRYYQSNSAFNRLELVTIEYGGGYWDGNLVLNGSSSSPVQLALLNCTITDSDTCGVDLNDYVNVTPADIQNNNTFANNELGDVCAD